MTYQRRKKKSNTIQICEVKSVRIGKKVCQKFVRYIGVEKETDKGKVIIPSHKNILDRIELIDNVTLGDVATLLHIAQELKIAETVDRFSIKGGGLHSGIQLQLLAINHAIAPQSLSVFASWYSDTALKMLTGIEPEKLNKDNLLSAMDGICRDYEETDGTVRVIDKTLPICKALVSIWSKFYGIPIDALYYDITSTYFEGVKCILAKLGYSRDEKRGKVQINIALVVTRRWQFPLFFRVFEGNVSDQKTVKELLEILKDEFGITECAMVIWDRGVASKSNVRRADRAKQKIICGLKKNEKAVQNIILSIDDKELLRSTNIVRDVENEYRIYATDTIVNLYGKKRKVVVYFNTQIQMAMQKDLAKKLRRARRMLTNYQKKLESGSYTKMDNVVLHVKKCTEGVAKFFKVTYHKNDKITISWEEKTKVLEKAESLHGKFAIMSTDLSLSYRDIVDAYFEKHGIEKAFRCLKQVVELHPTRCRLENRVKVHVFICFLSYLLLRVLEFKLRNKGMSITAENALKELGKIRQGVIVDPHTKNSALKVARLTELQKTIVQNLELSGYIKSAD